MIVVTNPPNIRLVTRSPHGFRVYWDGPTLNDCRFRPTLEGDNLLLDQVDEYDLEGNVVRASPDGLSSAWQSHYLKGDWFRLEGVKIPSVPSGDKLAYIIYGIPNLKVGPKSHKGRNPSWAIEARQAAAKMKTAEAPVEAPINGKEPPAPNAFEAAGDKVGVVATDQYLLRLLDAIERIEEITFHRLVKDVDGWAWRAPDIRRVKTNT